jgi:diaminopimelate decarboxylase
LKTIELSEIESIYRQKVADASIIKADTAVIFYDTSILKDRLQLLRSNFPVETLHAIAIKSNSSAEVLKTIADEGFGLEAASFEEVLLAKAAGVPNSKIVFDSPVKTKAEIEKCHQEYNGIIVNANSLEELERYPADFSGQLGLRINPLVDADAPDLFNVSKSTSKFGVPISKKEAIIQACLKYPFIAGLHIHIGSGIQHFEGNLVAIEKITALAESIQKARAEVGIKTSIQWIDIGGGIDFSDEKALSVAHFVSEIQSRTQLFESYKVITEFGRFVHQAAGFVVSDIEYIVDGVDDNAAKTAFIHVGADLFLRKVYSNLPIEYPFHIIRMNASFAKQSHRYNIAGPLCFNGDFLYYNLELPEFTTNDKFVIQNIGSNTLSMWSQHCSRKIPKLICY